MFTSNLPRTLYNTALVAIATWNYYRVSHDRDWLLHRGYGLLRDVADHLCALIAPSYVRAPFTGVITQVTLAGVLDSAGVVTTNHTLTNVAAYLAIKAAVEATYEIGHSPRPAWVELFNAEDGFGTNLLLAGIERPGSGGVLVHDPSAAYPPSPGSNDAWLVAWPLLFGHYATSEDVLTANVPGYSGTASLVQASVLALRAQTQVAAVDQTADVTTAHAAVTALMTAAATAGGGLVQDPVLCSMYLNFMLTVYGRLVVTGGTSSDRYVYAPYGVLRPVEPGGVLPTNWAALTITSGTSAGAFQITNEL